MRSDRSTILPPTIAQSRGWPEILSGRDTLIAATHDKRPGRTQDIAETVFFLASPGARHITGQTIHVNGGAYLTR